VLPIQQWDLTERVVVYRKRIHHQSPKNFQLDLFSPDDGTFEYSAVTTNESLLLWALWDFMSGRGAQEKTFFRAEERSRLGFSQNRNRAAMRWRELLAGLSAPSPK
jgi:hypothetical protein